MGGDRMKGSCIIFLPAPLTAENISLIIFFKALESLWPVWNQTIDISV